MSERFDADDVLARNPHIDREQIEEGMDLHRRLRDAGLQRKEYDLALPFGGRRASFKDDAHSDVRIIRKR